MTNEEANECTSAPLYGNVHEAASSSCLYLQALRFFNPTAL